MKTIRLEIHVTAFVHYGDALSSEVAPVGEPFRKADVTLVRSFDAPPFPLVALVTQNHAAAMLMDAYTKLPERLGRRAENLLSGANHGQKANEPDRWACENTRSRQPGETGNPFTGADASRPNNDRETSGV